MSFQERVGYFTGINEKKYLIRRDKNNGMGI